MDRPKSINFFDTYFGREYLDHDGRINGFQVLVFFPGANLPNQILAQVEVDLPLSSHVNACQWFETKKEQERKHEKVLVLHAKAFKAAKKKTQQQLSQVLKQVWDFSDQDGDNMIFLRELCIALYLMEQYREGHPFPPVLPPSIQIDEALKIGADVKTTTHHSMLW